MMKDYPMWVCHDCGSKAKGKAGNRDVSMHEGICGVCMKLKTVASPRDYGYPDFTQLIKELKDG